MTREEIEQFSNKDAEIAELRAKLAAVNLKASNLASWNEGLEYALEEARDEVAELRKDSERMDWLENEMSREQMSLAVGAPVYSLFRSNMPITRSAINAATEKGA
jgi:DNA repair exonuclease SbcCD ATPase subunit